MITEKAQVISIADEVLWVEAVRRSACGACVAEKGCGQRLLAKLSGKTVRLRVLPGEWALKDYRPGEIVEIGIPDDVVVRGSLLVYMLPLVVMLAATLLGYQVFAPESGVFKNANLYRELGTVIFAGLGLLAGARFVRRMSSFRGFDQRVQPRVVSRDLCEPAGVQQIQNMQVR